MAITKIRIHPAIGIARLGNSPDEFFVGPEKPWDRTPPPGGYKDSLCRIKRQAAKFRLWAYDENDNPVQEITKADAAITWTVELANTKPASIEYSAGYVSTDLRNPTVATVDRGGLKITPGSKTLNGPLQQAKFDSGAFKLPGESPVPVPLGEIRTDDNSRLLVLGGFGDSGHVNGSTSLNFDNNDKWYDDASDGPVTATVTLNGQANPTPVVDAWVIVGPPSYAPSIENVITMYDFLYDIFVRQGRLIPPAKPSFTQHIYPILRSGVNISAVYQLSASVHSTMTFPVPPGQSRVDIFNRLQPPTSSSEAWPENMPSLNDNPRRETTLTPTQYSWMEKWRDDDGADSLILNDWAGPPTPPAAITPEGLDKAALENACGGAFFPGMEAGEFLMEDVNTTIANSKYIEPFRLDRNKVNPGQVTERMGIPWQADFKACGTGWWPVTRPNKVIPQGQTGYESWDRDIGNEYDMTLNWHTAGFVVEQSGKFVETEKCPSTYITLLTPSLNFKDIPVGPGGMSRYQALAIEFEILSPAASVSLELLSVPSDASLTAVDPGPFSLGQTSNTAPQTMRIWIKYTTQAVGHSITDSVTIRNPSTSETWQINILANTVDRKKAAVALILDRSGSMSEDRGDGTDTKISNLRLAASNFIDLMLAEDALSLVRYNHNAQLLTSLTQLGPNDGTDPARNTADQKISGSDLNPSGSTSIGDGLNLGHNQISGVSGYNTKSLLVITDGKENNPLYIADVAGSINANTYAIGIGTAQNTSAAALQALSGNHGGYMLITGDITGDNDFILRKYFIQILAGINNAEIITDPQGTLKPGTTHRIPFTVNEADTGIEVIVLTSQPEWLDFRIETPLGNIIDPGVAGANASIRFVASKGMAFYRLSLPQEFQPARPNHEGKWHAILSIRYDKPERDDSHGTSHHGGIKELIYNLMVHAYSDLRLNGVTMQKSFEPGAQATLQANLSQFGIPISQKTYVWAEITQPDGHMVDYPLQQTTPGLFQASYDTSIQGIYKVRLRARGNSRDGWPFYREFTQTVPVWKGGDTVPKRPEFGENGRPLNCCHLFWCRLIRFIKSLFCHRRFPVRSMQQRG